MKGPLFIFSSELYAGPIRILFFFGHAVRNSNVSADLIGIEATISNKTIYTIVKPVF